jgi:hypothetical protein
MTERTNGSEADEMESELIAVATALLVVAAVVLVALGAGPTPLDAHAAAVRAAGEAHALVSLLADRLPR